MLIADDDYESIGLLLKIRAPSLLIGLVLGSGISFATSRFAEVLTQSVQVAYFLPFIIYIADSIGSQTEAIYSRSLEKGEAKFGTYLVKESMLGIIFGIAFGTLASVAVLMWLDNGLLAKSIAIATFLAIASAPVTALIVTQACQFIHEDPAAGSGPIATVIQDMISVIIYGTVCSAILLG